MGFVVLSLFISALGVARPSASPFGSDAPLPICVSTQATPVQPCVATPFVLRWGTPHYTDEARRKELEGLVILSLVIGKTGIPRDVQVVQSLDKGLDEQAVAAAQQSRFRPPKYKGHPVSAKATMKVAFKNCKSYGVGLTRTSFELDGPPHRLAALGKHLHECTHVNKEGRHLPCAPLLIRMILPEVKDAQQAGLEDSILFSFTIDDRGLTKDIRVIKSVGARLDEQVMEAVAQWKYRPAIYKDDTIPVKATVELTFGRCRAATAFIAALD
jgi:TonB family protein